MSIDPEKFRKELENLVLKFDSKLDKSDLREKVKGLIPIFQTLRKLGKSIVPDTYKLSARDRILHYFRLHPKAVLAGDEILVVSGIQDYPRRIRELRVQFGWPILSGKTIKEMMLEEGDETLSEYSKMKPSDYILLSDTQDLEAAHRWNVANDIRKKTGSVKEKIISYLRSNVGKEVTNEELRYVANNQSEWARRTRELRTEEGWPIVTKNKGRPDLDVGVYVLEADRQSPVHDRNIPDKVRGEVLRRDKSTCQDCGWSHAEWNPSDPRHLELHHIKHHAKGGENIASNLKTLCTVCHDDVHRLEK